MYLIVTTQSMHTSHVILVIFGPNNPLLLLFKNKLSNLRPHAYMNLVNECLYVLH